MRITFFSNFLNHHQLSFCIEMYNLIGENFKFVATEPIHEERLKMGYEDMSNMYPFSLNTYSNSENYLEGIKLGNESDVVIIGAAPDIFIKNRLIDNKLTFRYSERIFKKGQWRVLNPRNFVSLFFKHTQYRNKSLYMLCASAYTACDFALINAYKDKTYKWGYFPAVKEFDLDKLFLKKNNSVPKILWVGRLLKLKHPEHVIKLANELNKHGYNFTIDIIGTGVMEEYIKNLINKYNLDDKVKIYGFMSPDMVREHMEAANIYLFTSDYNEGWGAVLNESMNSGCAVVASHAIGSVPFLIKHEENGLIYKNGNLQQLYECVKKLLEDSSLCDKIGKAAYITLSKVWNAKIAVDRIIKLSDSLLKGEKVYFKDGPCSKAKIIKQNVMYTYITRK